MAPLEDVYVTLVITDSYLPGAAVLAHSLRDAGTQKKLACMITTETLSADVITELKQLYDYVIAVPRIANPNPKNLYLMDRGDLLFTFTKINLWRQTQFRKIVYLDADIVALRAPDELFDIQASFAAAPDIGWPDAFNSGVMVLTPNMGEYWALQTMAASGDSFDGADQGLLNQYFEHRPWQRISFTYNCTPNAEYQWEPAYRFYKANIKMVHFIGKQKPWTKGRHTKSNKGIYNELHSRWWAVYDRHLKTTQQYVPGQAFSAPSSVIRRYVAGEAYDVHGGTAPEERIAPPSSTDVAPTMLLSKNQFPQPSQPEPVNETPAIRAEAPFTEPGERHENIEQGIEQPQSTREQRRFSAPSMEWDATRSAPPAQSKPEAANFPQQLYSFSDDKKPYQPPQSFPEPPKDMYYEVPKTPTTPTMKPKAIFPWEKDEHRPKATRTFAEDLPPPPTLTLSPTDGPTKPISAARDFATEPDYEEPIFQPFAPQRNAWDDDKSIDRYVRAVMEAQTRRGKPGHDTDEILDRSGAGRRESLILTDFPSYDDRPSLPVTPAPIRRSKFWGEERDVAGDLPAAAGVPDQADWDPNQKLEQLRRNSVQELEHLKDSTPSNNTKISQRGMPEHASRLSSELEKIEESQHEDLGAANVANSGPVSVATASAEQTQHATSTGQPVFSEPDFAVPQPIRTRSPGSFSAESIRLAENLSPTER